MLEFFRADSSGGTLKSGLPQPRRRRRPGAVKTADRMGRQRGRLAPTWLRIPSRIVERWKCSPMGGRPRCTARTPSPCGQHASPARTSTRGEASVYVGQYGEGARPERRLLQRRTFAQYFERGWFTLGAERPRNDAILGQRARVQPFRAVAAPSEGRSKALNLVKLRGTGPDSGEGSVNLSTASADRGRAS